MIAVLFCDAAGVYSTLEGVDIWPEARDARTYAGPFPVVAHPPCDRWCGFARLNERRYGIPVGSDEGCFESALSSVERFGGVLEHPAGSLAWEMFGLTRPHRGAWQRAKGGYVTEVSQSAYGHKARKRTWLYAVTAGEPPPADWADPRGTHQIGWFDRKRPVLSKKEGSATPRLFAAYLLGIARSA